MEEIRIALAVATVLRVFVEDPERSQYGYDLMRRTGFPSGKLYPILARLVAAGWLTRQADAVESAEAGRPARRHYRLDPRCVARVRVELAALNQRLNPESSPTGPGRLRPDRRPT
jgi:PadR family transcriptional regulator, regulatory protein PadR